MTSTRYPQFCSLARAAEIIGERWTLLILRELMVRPRRFTDLRRRLDGISTSVLSQRLARLEADGIIRHVPPNPGETPSVYELTADGRDLQPIVLGLVAWGMRFLLPAPEGERLEPEWVLPALMSTARHDATPPVSLKLHITGGDTEADVFLAGGEQGTSVSMEPHPVDATITISAQRAMMVAARGQSLERAVQIGEARIEGDADAAAAYPDLFEIQLGRSI